MTSLFSCPGTVDTESRGNDTVTVQNGLECIVANCGQYYRHKSLVISSHQYKQSIIGYVMRVPTENSKLWVGIHRSHRLIAAHISGMIKPIT